MKIAALLAFLVAIATPLSGLAAEGETDQETWRSEIAVARARAKAQRAEFKADFERRKAERLLNPQSTEDIEREQARRLSEQVKNDYTLKKGDIVSTIDGLLVYQGASPDARALNDFIPLPQDGRRR